MTNTPTFGPGGNGDLFYAQGNKSTLQAPGWLEQYGLDAFEYEAGNGIAAGEATLRAIGERQESITSECPCIPRILSLFPA